MTCDGHQMPPCRSTDQNVAALPRVTFNSEKLLPSFRPPPPAQRHTEGCTPANTPTDSIYAIFAQWSRMAAVGGGGGWGVVVVNEAGSAA